MNRCREVDISSFSVFEVVSKNFRTGRLEPQLHIVHLYVTGYGCVAILRVSLVSFVAITLFVASQLVFIVIVVVVPFSTQSGNFWIHPRKSPKEFLHYVDVNYDKFHKLLNCSSQSVSLFDRLLYREDYTLQLCAHLIQHELHKGYIESSKISRERIASNLYKHLTIVFHSSTYLNTE
jgi:hypothetical protein